MSIYIITEFSLLDGAAKIKDMVAKAADCGMSHVAITDHGNMFGVPKFVLNARKNGVKPIVGCEFYIIAGDATQRDRTQKSISLDLVGQECGRLQKSGKALFLWLHRWLLLQA